MNLSFVKTLEIALVFIEILIKVLLFNGGVRIYAEHCISVQNCLSFSAYRITQFTVYSKFPIVY